MAFTPDSYIGASRALSQIITDANSFNEDVKRGIDILTVAHQRLAAMATDWRDAAQFIDAQAAANPQDAQWASLKAEKDKVVTDFLQMRNRALAVRDAANGAA